MSNGNSIYSTKFYTDIQNAVAKLQKQYVLNSSLYDCIGRQSQQDWHSTNYNLWIEWTYRRVIKRTPSSNSRVDSSLSWTVFSLYTVSCGDCSQWTWVSLQGCVCFWWTRSEISIIQSWLYSCKDLSFLCWFDRIMGVPIVFVLNWKNSPIRFNSSKYRVLF